jgi:hypothetical protein
MASLDIPSMRRYLSQSLSSVNANKLNGLLAEIDFRRHLGALGYTDRVSPGGWVVRTKGPARFGLQTCVFFPQTVLPGTSYDPRRAPGDPPLGLHTIAATFHQTGIHAYYCVPDVDGTNDETSVAWRAVQLGLPAIGAFHAFPDLIPGFAPRGRTYNYLRYTSDTTPVSDAFIPEEFSKEAVRIAFSTRFLSEMSDVDGIVWGKQHTYPVEVKEKTAATSADLGDYFGLDVGPFVKLAFYAAKKGNLHSLFVVREIADETTRTLAGWWAITFDTLAQYASWVYQGGGTNMRGGASSVVRVPKAEFKQLDVAFLDGL